MPTCLLCGDEMEEVIVCKNDDYCFEEFDCYDRDCYEPVNAGWECRNCGLEV